MVLREGHVQVTVGVGAAEHVLSVAHAMLGQLVLPAERCCVLELGDAALILCKSEDDLHIIM